MDGTIEGIDWTSQLPEESFHQILSCLFTKEAARTSVLSKTWLRAWSTYPNLDFVESYFMKESLCKCSDADLKGKDDPKIQETREKFLHYVDKTMLRYHKERTPINKFRLHITSVYPKWASIIDKWIEILVQKHVEELELHLSDYAFLGSLLKKHLCNGIIKCYPLQMLGLKKVCINEEEIQDIFSRCPLIKELRLLDCRGLKKLQVANLHNLKTVHVKNIEEVEIRAAPNLQSFNYVVTNGLPHTNGLPWMFNIDSSPHLKDLMLMGLGMTDRFFHDLIARFPLLEKLELRFCHEIRRINISSRILKSFVLRYCLKLEEAKIDAPNLLSVKYDRMPSLSITTTTSPQKWEPIVNFLGAITGLSSFIRLREFIMSFNQSVTLGFNVFDWPEKKRLKNVDLKRMPLIDQVPVIEHLKLRVFSDLRLCCESLVDSLFWSCHPRKLSLVSIKLNKTLIEKLCEMLMEREDDPCCCSSSNSKCWRHYLKNVEIGSFELKNKVERPLHLKTSSDLFPSLGEHQGVYFKLKW